MTRRLGIGVLAALALAAIGAAWAQSNTGNVEADQAAIRQVWVAYANAVETADVNAYMALWADDGVQMPPGAPPNVGKDMIRARTVKGFGSRGDSTTVMQIDPQEITVIGDWAYTRGLYTVTVTPKSGGTVGHVDGKFMTVLRRQQDGSWKLYRDIFNSNVPPA